jgi:3-hydroxyisobutyrate dehydrogenase-like beta-hydroxyacid dehydrogenase
MQAMSSIKVGFIGLGNIGFPMARSLAKKEFLLTIYSRHPDVTDAMTTLGAAAVNSSREVAAASDVVISVVRDIPQTDEVLFGANGAWEGLKRGSAIVLSSTIGPEYCQKLYARGKERGIQVIDAALSKDTITNEEGQFTLMIGGDDDAVKRYWPVFEALGKHVFHVGGTGMGQAYKVINQMAFFNIKAGVTECLNLGLKAGLDLQKMMDVLQVGTGESWYLRNLNYLVKARKLKAPFNAPNRNDGMKDITLALALAQKSGANAPVLKFVTDLDHGAAFDAYYAGPGK